MSRASSWSSRAATTTTTSWSDRIRQPLVANEPALVGVGHLGGALDRRHPADRGLDLDVLQVCLAGERAERVRRVGDELLVAPVLGPLVARAERLSLPWWRPEREHVVDQVVMEVDQAGVDRPRRSGPAEPSRSRAVPGRSGAGPHGSARQRRCHSAPSSTSGRSGSKVTSLPEEHQRIRHGSSPPTPPHRSWRSVTGGEHHSTHHAAPIPRRYAMLRVAGTLNVVLSAFPIRGHPECGECALVRSRTAGGAQ
jgi:hypothetical protein